VSSGTVTAGSLTGNITGGAVTVTGALTGNVTAGTVTAGSMIGNVSSSVTVTGQLAGEITAGTNALGSLSSASVTGGTNTITGAANVTTINGGTTTVTGVATITTLTTGTLNLNGATSLIGTLNGGTVNLGAATVLTVNDGTFGGLLTGATAKLFKTTAGTLIISGANTFGGGTTVDAGTLTVGNITALGTGAVTIASGATLNLAGFGVANAITVATGGTITGGPQADSPAVLAKLSGSNTIDTVLTGPVGLTKDGAGELSLTTPNFFTGGIVADAVGAIISAAYLADDSSSLGASLLSDASKLILGNGATLEFTGTTATTTSRSFTVNGSAVLAVDAAAAPLTFSSASSIALDPSDSTPELKLTAFNAGLNRFNAQLLSLIHI
jgi:fibronectin-binding autotransporter adhesin